MGAIVDYLSRARGPRWILFTRKEARWVQLPWDFSQATA
jgi:hypothetical protein